MGTIMQIPWTHQCMGTITQKLFDSGVPLCLLICSSGPGWCMVCVCGVSVFSALVLSHHMMVNLCQLETSFSLPRTAFTVTHHISHAQSFHPGNQSAGRPSCGTSERANTPWKITLQFVDVLEVLTQLLSDCLELPGHFWMILQKNKTEELHLFRNKLPSSSYFPCVETLSVSTVDVTCDSFCSRQISWLLCVSLSLSVNQQ